MPGRTRQPERRVSLQLPDGPQILCSLWTGRGSIAGIHRERGKRRGSGSLDEPKRCDSAKENHGLEPAFFSEPALAIA